MALHTLSTEVQCTSGEVRQGREVREWRVSQPGGSSGPNLAARRYSALLQKRGGRDQRMEGLPGAGKVQKSTHWLYPIIYTSSLHGTLPSLWSWVFGLGFWPGSWVLSLGSRMLWGRYIQYLATVRYCKNDLRTSDTTESRE
jgi:hypothetical protein